MFRVDFRIGRCGFGGLGVRLVACNVSFGDALVCFFFECVVRGVAAVRRFFFGN